jgi:capsular polysaccharide export protein
LKSNNIQKKFLFISRKSSHYRYYQKLVAFIGGSAELHQLKLISLPHIAYWKHLEKLNFDELVDVHVRRKIVRHPWLVTFKPLLSVVKSSYILLEKLRASYYFKLFLNGEYDTVILWNGMKQPNKTPYQVAKVCGKKTMLFENGLLPNTTVLDAKGVNALNSVPREPHFYRDINIDDSEITKKLVVRQPHKNRKLDEQNVVLPESFIFVPFQVPNDTQIVCHSPWIDSMEAFHQVLEHALIELDSKPDLCFVIKEHPSWPRSFKHLHDKNPRIIFANNMNTQDLVERSTAVVTINSTVGIEALLLNKKVITLGNTFLNVEGLVWHADNQQEFTKLLANIDDVIVDETFVRQFLTYLNSEYLIPDAWQDVNASSFAHLNEVKRRLETF